MTELDGDGYLNRDQLKYHNVAERKDKLKVPEDKTRGRFDTILEDVLL